MLYRVFGHARGYRYISEVVEDEATAERMALDWVETDKALWASFEPVDYTLMRCPRGCGHIGMMHGKGGCEGLTDELLSCECKFSC